MKVGIRADSSSMIGSGHVARCLTLAQELRNLGAEVQFISYPHPNHMGEVIRAEKFSFVELAPGANDQKARADQSSWLPLGEVEDARQTCASLKKFAPELMIVDHYGIGRVWESQVTKVLGSAILAIDDLADRAHDCEFLLDQNFYQNLSSRYDSLVSSKTRKLLGPQFVLFKSAYLEAAKRPREARASLKNIFVFYGGADFTNETEKVVSALVPVLTPVMTLHVLMGQSNPRRQAVTEKYRNPQIQFYSSLPNLVDLMAQCDLAFGAGGVNTWERCLSGLPSVMTAIAPNQYQLCKDLSTTGACIYLGTSDSVQRKDIQQSLQKLLQNTELLEKMSLSAKALFTNPMGAAGVAEMLSEEIGK